MDVKSSTIKIHVECLAAVSNFIDTKPYGEIQSLRRQYSVANDELAIKEWFLNCMKRKTTNPRHMQEVYDSLLQTHEESIDALAPLKTEIDALAVLKAKMGGRIVP